MSEPTEQTTFDERVAALRQHLASARDLAADLKKEMQRYTTDEARHAIGNVAHHCGKAGFYASQVRK